MKRIEKELKQLCCHKIELKIIKLYIHWRKLVCKTPHLIHLGLVHTFITALLLLSFPVPDNVPLSALLYTCVLSYFITARILLPSPRKYQEPRTQPHWVGKG